jgi:glucose-1-phosphate adenylyltransferase
VFGAPFVVGRSRFEKKKGDRKCLCVCVWALLVGVDFEEAGMAAALAAKTAVWTPSSSFSSACLSEASKAGSMVAGSGSFVTGACLQLGSRTSSLRGTGVASTNSMRCQRSSRSIGVVSPRAVSDSQSPGDTCLDPDASRSVLGIILGGGAGTRLYPLTKKRAKPAVPLGANYRLIDIPVSNCINSNINKIYVLTQYNSASLNRHLSRAYSSNMGGYKNEGFVEVLAAQQSPENPNWFQGTADAVRQYLWLFEEAQVLEYVVLAGDHLYRMDYQQFIQVHRETNADITVAALPMDEARATAFGLMKINEKGRVVEFSEKPKGDALKAMQVHLFKVLYQSWRDLCLCLIPRDAHCYLVQILPSATVIKIDHD